MHSPTLDEFLKLATQGNLIPVTRRILAAYPEFGATGAGSSSPIPDLNGAFRG